VEFSTVKRSDKARGVLGRCVGTCLSMWAVTRLCTRPEEQKQFQGCAHVQRNRNSFKAVHMSRGTETVSSLAEGSGWPQMLLAQCCSKDGRGESHYSSKTTTDCHSYNFSDTVCEYDQEGSSYGVYLRIDHVVPCESQGFEWGLITGWANLVL
jgi:hypothetical protein